MLERKMSRFGIMQQLDVVICKDAEDAVSQGFLYTPENFTPVEIDKVVVVRNGTEAGHSTVDLVLKDEDGKQFVVMVTGNLLKSIPC
jgi:hypothetical protein